MLELESIIYGTFALGILALALFFIKNDEFLFLIVGFFYSAGISRYKLVASGGDGWVRVAYSRNIFNLTNELGLKALNYFFLGTAVLTIAYFMFAMNQKPPPIMKDSDSTLKGFLKLAQTFVIGLFVGISVISFYAKLSFADAYRNSGASIALGGSYYIMLGFGLGGVISLMYLVFKNYDQKKQLLSKVIFGAIIAFAGSLTYSSTGRFQFLSWSITMGLIFVGDKNPLYKLRVYLIGGLIVSLAFGLAGVSRRTDTSQLSFMQKMSLAWNRNTSTEDATMLDGFMMVLQVYPQHLEYHYGTEHLEILYRPIPRSMWPGKPLGGYANKLGLNDNMGGGSVGISQSIYGSFYGEGGVGGIIVLSIVYAFIFSRIFAFACSYNSDIRFLIKGMAISSAVPLVRGGDLPGIYAFIGMTFWPVWLFLYRYRGYRSLLKMQNIKNLRFRNAFKQQDQEHIEKDMV